MTKFKLKYIVKLLLSLMIFLSLAFPLPIFAHAIMVRQQPEADSTIAKAPKQVDVWFNDKVGSEYKALAVVNSKGERVDNKDVAQETFDPSHLYTTVKELPPDTYTVKYRVVSLDTHIVTGKFKFTIKKP